MSKIENNVYYIILLTFSFEFELKYSRINIVVRKLLVKVIMTNYSNHIINYYYYIVKYFYSKFWLVMLYINWLRLFYIV